MVVRGLQASALEAARELGIEVGSAYWKHGEGDFELIRPVDTTLSNYELALAFSIPDIEELKQSLEDLGEPATNMLRELTERHDK